MIPDWMINDAAGSGQTGTYSGRAGTARFIDHTLKEIRGSLQNQLQTEQFARLPGFLQQFDPRVKLIAMILFILVTSLCHSLPVLCMMWLLTLVLFCGSRLPAARIQILIWAVIPVISIIVSVPAALNILVPGHELLAIYDSGTDHISFIYWNLPGRIYLTEEGSLAAIRLAARSGLSISAALLLVLTTPAAKVFRSLSALRLPAYFIMIMEMCYRYMVVLFNTAIEIFEARKVRTVGRLDGRRLRQQYGSSLAALFARSMALCEEVFQAMTARGYTGEIPGIGKSPLAPRDWAFALSSLVLLLFFYIGGLYSAS